MKSILNNSTKIIYEKAVDNKVKDISKLIKDTKQPKEKQIWLNYMGDLRLQSYRITGNPYQRKLAANCYIAAKIIR